MGFLWGLLKAVVIVFAVIIGILVIVDASLIGNLFRRRES